MSEKCKSCQARDNYIKFLGKCIGDNAVYMHIHNMDSKEDVIKEGEKLRAEIMRVDSK